MARYVSRRAPIAASTLKRKALGSVVVHHWNYGEVRFTRVAGGWLCEREDSVWVSPAKVVSSADVANECNKAVGCKESWAKVYQSQIPTGLSQALCLAFLFFYFLFFFHFNWELIDLMFLK